MKRTLIQDLCGATGQTVMIHGWLQTLRDQKKMQFLIIRDTTGMVQVVLEKAANPELAGLISRLTAETALTIVGKVIGNPSVRLGGLEIQLESCRIEALAEAQLPIDPFAETLPAIDTRLDWRYLDLRRPENLLLFNVQTTALAAMREYWVQNRFIEIFTPKLMGSPSESGAELFELPYFETKAYLAQSPQFYKQMAMAAGFERVFEIGPVFRADPSFTSRHMTEFTSIDMEMSWVNAHEDVIVSIENWLQHVFRRVAEAHGQEIQTRLGFTVTVPALPFPRITMAEAMEVLNAYNYQLPPERKGDIDPGGERLLGQWVKQKFDHDIFFLTDWPVTARPFYHMRHPDAPGLTRSFDVIARGLEIITGAQREHRYDVLKQQAVEKGLRLDLIQFYLDFFRYGCPPHGGFALGLARFLMVLLGIQNIRETVFLFRGPARLQP